MFNPKSPQAQAKAAAKKAKFLYVLFKESAPFDPLLTASTNLWSDTSPVRTQEE